MEYPIYDRSGVEDEDILDNMFDTGEVVDVETASKGSSRAGSRAERRQMEESKSKRSLLYRALTLVSILIIVNVVLLCLLGIAVVAGYNGILSPSLLAFSFGLRHAVDADHIAAIDNVTRKLISEGKKPLSVGLWFSLGHSTVVVLLCIAIAAGSTFAREHIGSASNIGQIIGTAVSATVLLIIGTLNMLLARRLWAQWKSIGRDASRSNRLLRQESGDRSAAPGAHSHDGGITWHTHLVEITPAAEVEGLDGFFTRCCPGIFRSVDSEWKMYPIGFLFGLGFDTASEVGLLALAATNPTNSDGKAIPGWITLLMPLLFAAGMSLLDTLDGILMLWSYSWATLHPERKIAFNLFLTVVSGCIALFVGFVETLGCFQQELHLNGGLWAAVKAVNDNFEYVGYGIIAFFVISSFLAVCWFKYFLNPRLRGQSEDGGAVTEYAYRRISESKESDDSRTRYFPVEDNDDDDAANSRQSDADLIRDKFSKMSSAKLVKYIRKNAPEGFLRGPMQNILDGRVIDVARNCKHADLSELCRRIAAELGA